MVDFLIKNGVNYIKISHFSVISWVYHLTILEFKLQPVFYPDPSSSVYHLTILEFKLDHDCTGRSV